MGSITPQVKVNIVQILTDPQSQQRKTQMIEEIKKKKMDEELKEETFKPKTNKKMNQLLVQNQMRVTTGSKHHDLYNLAQNKTRKNRTGEEFEY
jgi:hypothetical protein